MVRIIDPKTRTLIEEIRGTKINSEPGTYFNCTLDRKNYDRSVVIEIPEGVRLDIYACNFDADLMLVATKTAVHYGVPQVELSNVVVDGVFSINSARIGISRIFQCSLLRTAIIDYPWEKDEFPTPVKPFDAQ